ncbi:LysE family translocator [Brachybacterium alimentarium]|uniref:LysE family translocator n=1 Tax=Brachybacterium alimentarium TaxID=47845 RepID=UPI001C6A033B|nr:LysE family translocator [Brachybacterium alimentarium]
MGVEFWIASIVVTATPGTGALFTIAAGLGRGTRAGLVAALGCTLGIVPHLVLALTGAAAVIAASPVAFEAIKWLGVAYLLYMAWGTWQQTGILAPDSGEESERSRSAARVISGAVLVNLLNPKLTVFFFVFLPMFVDTTAEGAVLRMAWLGLVFMAITLVNLHRLRRLRRVAAAVCGGPPGRDALDRPGVLRLVRGAGSDPRVHTSVADDGLMPV